MVARQLPSPAGFAGLKSSISTAAGSTEGRGRGRVHRTVSLFDFIAERRDNVFRFIHCEYSVACIANDIFFGTGLAVVIISLVVAVAVEERCSALGARYSMTRKDIFLGRYCIYHLPVYKYISGLLNHFISTRP